MAGEDCCGSISHLNRPNHNSRWLLRFRSIWVFHNAQHSSDHLFADPFGLWRLRVFPNTKCSMLVSTKEKLEKIWLTKLSVTFTAWVGIIAAQSVGWLVGDRIPLWASRRFDEGVWHPEYRLWDMVVPALISPLGLGIFGAGLQYHLHFMVLSLGNFLVVFSATLSVPVCTNYVVECFVSSSNEVAISMNMYRLAFSIALGFFIFPWESDVGLGWVFGMAAFFDVFAALLIGFLAWKGKSLRRFSPKNLQATEDGAKVEFPGVGTPAAMKAAEDPMQQVRETFEV